jgi:hypothetical protein
MAARDQLSHGGWHLAAAGMAAGRSPPARPLARPPDSDI